MFDIWLHLIALTGCLSPIALNRAVIAYDEAVTDAISQQCLSIRPGALMAADSFYRVSNITATFTFAANACALRHWETCQQPDAILAVALPKALRSVSQRRLKAKNYQTAVDAISAEQADIVTASTL